MKELEAFDIETGEDDMNQPQMFNNYMDNSLLSEDGKTPKGTQNDRSPQRMHSEDKRQTFIQNRQETPAFDDDGTESEQPFKNISPAQSKDSKRKGSPNMNRRGSTKMMEMIEIKAKPTLEALTEH